MTLYDVLKCAEGASKAEVRKAFLKAAKQNHPDRGGKGETLDLENIMRTQILENLMICMYS